MSSSSSCRPERLRYPTCVLQESCLCRLHDGAWLCSALRLKVFVLLRQAYQLIRAVSVLLNFTREEEDMLKQTLEYKVGAFRALLKGANPKANIQN